jgi:hypothetical protein
MLSNHISKRIKNNQQPNYQYKIAGVISILQFSIECCRNCHDCLLWGPLPAELGNLSKLIKMWIYNNDLTGSIPDTWQGLTSISEMKIELNYLSGPIPTWILNLPNLKTV